MQTEELQEELDALERAIASGVKRVKYADKDMEYDDLDGLLRRRDFLLGLMGQQTRPRRTYPSHCKGF